MNKIFSVFTLMMLIPFSVTTLNATEQRAGIESIVGTWEGVAVGVTEESIRLANYNITEAIAASEMQMVITQATEDFCIAVFKWINPEAKKINYDGDKYTSKGSWNSICLYDDQDNKLFFEGNEATMTCYFPKNTLTDRKKLDCYYLRSSFEHHSVAKFHLTKTESP